MPRMAYRTRKVSVFIPTNKKAPTGVRSCVYNSSYRPSYDKFFRKFAEDSKDGPLHPITVRG